MDLVSGKPFWPLRNGLLRVYPPLANSTEATAVVLGAGITGALVAYHLAAAGVEVIVIDRRDVAAGSTAASTSLLQYEIDLPLWQLARRIGEKQAVRAYQACLEALREVARLDRKLRGGNGFMSCGSLQGASRRTHVAGLRRETQLRQAHGFEVDFWSRTRLRRESTLPFHGALVSAQASALDPHRFTHALLAAAVARGARVYDRTLVTRRKAKSGGIRLLTQTGRHIDTRHLVIATGYETEPYLPDRLTQLVSTYVMITEPCAMIEGWPGRRHIWETAHPYAYLRQTEDRRLIIGGLDEPFRDPRRRDALLEKKRRQLRSRLTRWMPKIDFEPAAAWCGTFAETPDGLPYIGRHPRVTDTYFALGYGGNGITFSLIAARLIRDLILEGSSRDEDLFGFARATARPGRNPALP